MAENKSKSRLSGTFYQTVSTEPSPGDYAEYVEELDGWLRFVEGLVMVELAVDNTGEASAEDLEIALKPPRDLEFLTELPDKPSFPQSVIARVYARPAIPSVPAADEVGGPYRNEHRMVLSWEVGKLYHGRPLATDSSPEYVNGLLLDREGFERVAASNSGKVEIPYTIQAANLRRPVEGTLRLLPPSC